MTIQKVFTYVNLMTGSHFPVTALLWDVSLPAWGPAVPAAPLPQRTADVLRPQPSRLPHTHPHGTPPWGHSTITPTLPRAPSGAGRSRRLLQPREGPRGSQRGWHRRQGNAALGLGRLSLLIIFLPVISDAAGYHVCTWLWCWLFPRQRNMLRICLDPF